jgi:biopolymer transport protein ExbD
MKFFLLIAFTSVLSLKGFCQVPNNSPESSAIKKKTVIVTLDHRGNYFIDSKKVDSTKFDSSLVAALKKLQPQLKLDSPIVVINSDSEVSFGKIYHVMQLAKKSRARVVFNMKLD